MSSIHLMNLSAIDLNLLVALEALIAEAHVGRAARRIGRSQPAVSHSLQRLRELLSDPLLVRAGTKMELTPRALNLREPLAEALERVRGLLISESFRPAASSRRFLMMMQDHLADLIMPRLVERIHAEAPDARLEVVPWESPASMGPERLRSIDLCISCSTAGIPGFERTPLFTDTECVVLRRGHPHTRKMRDVRTFLEIGHVAVVSRGRTEDPVDAWLREEGVTRRIALVVPSYLQALHAVAATDLAAVVPLRLAQTLAECLSIVVVQPAIDPGSYQECLLYPLRRQRDPAALWLREIVLGIGRRIERRGLPALIRPKGRLAG
jgi:DNA-binding transcriptional LysR family regulator